MVCSDSSPSSAASKKNIFFGASSSEETSPSRDDNENVSFALASLTSKSMVKNIPLSFSSSRPITPLPSYSPMTRFESPTPSVASIQDQQSPTVASIRQECSSTPNTRRVRFSPFLSDRKKNNNTTTTVTTMRRQPRLHGLALHELEINGGVNVPRSAALPKKNSSPFASLTATEALLLSAGIAGHHEGDQPPPSPSSLRSPLSLYSNKKKKRRWPIHVLENRLLRVTQFIAQAEIEMKMASNDAEDLERENEILRKKVVLPKSKEEMEESLRYKVKKYDKKTNSLVEKIAALERSKQQLLFLEQQQQQQQQQQIVILNR